MTEREKLTKLLRESNASFEYSSPEKIADYLLDNGVILLPYKIGSTVYRINRVLIPQKMYDEEENIQIVEYTNVIESTLERNDISINEVYLTREAAEKARNLPSQARDLHKITI